MYLAGGPPVSESELAYARFLRKPSRVRLHLKRVLKEWPLTCEQFLTHGRANRTAWLSWAAFCIGEGTGDPRKFRGGYALLSPEEKEAAEVVLQAALEQWERTLDPDRLAFLAMLDGMQEPIQLHPGLGMKSKILFYIDTWKRRGYAQGIPDEVPEALSYGGIGGGTGALVPSWKVICQAILRNDPSLKTLAVSSRGFTPAWRKAKGITDHKVFYEQIKAATAERRGRQAVSSARTSAD